jgi:hypothetical protein
MKEYVIEIESYIVHLYFGDTDNDTHKMLLEAKHKGVPLIGPYSTQKHVDRTGKGQEHLHIYSKNNEIFAINKDGTAHDQSHGAIIPNKVAQALRKHFPDFKIPPNNLIESAPHQVDLMFLIEKYI